MGAPPRPGRPTEGPPPSDEQPSIRVAMAASMLRHGHDPARVAAITEVPLALVELIAEHHPPGSARPGRPGSPSTDPAAAGDNCAEDNSADPTGNRWAAIQQAHTQQLRRRRRIRIIRGAVICLAVTNGLCALAVLTHLDALTTTCLILAPLIYTTLLLLILPPRRPRTRRDRPH